MYWKIGCSMGSLFSRRDASAATRHTSDSAKPGQSSTTPGWTFLTGKKEDVNQVIARLGQYVEDREGHSTLLIAGNEKRKHWTKIRPDEPSTAVAERVRRLAGEP